LTLANADGTTNGCGSFGEERRDASVQNAVGLMHLGSYFNLKDDLLGGDKDDLDTELIVNVGGEGLRVWGDFTHGGILNTERPVAPFAFVGWASEARDNNAVRRLRGDVHDGHVRVGTTGATVHCAVRAGVRALQYLRILVRGVALWHRRGRLVGGRVSAVLVASPVAFRV